MLLVRVEFRRAIKINPQVQLLAEKVLLVLFAKRRAEKLTLEVSAVMVTANMNKEEAVEAAAVVPVDMSLAQTLLAAAAVPVAMLKMTNLPPVKAPVTVEAMVVVVALGPDISIAGKLVKPRSPVVLAATLVNLEQTVAPGTELLLYAGNKSLRLEIKEKRFLL